MRSGLSISGDAMLRHLIKDQVPNILVEVHVPCARDDCKLAVLRQLSRRGAMIRWHKRVMITMKVKQWHVAVREILSQRVRNGHHCVDMVFRDLMI